MAAHSTLANPSVAEPGSAPELEYLLSTVDYPDFAPPDFAIGIVPFLGRGQRITLRDTADLPSGDRDLRVAS